MESNEEISQKVSTVGAGRSIGRFRCMCDLRVFTGYVIRQVPLEPTEFRNSVSLLRRIYYRTYRQLSPELLPVLHGRGTLGDQTRLSGMTAKVVNPRNS